ncbi:MAG: flagellar motor switch protein FliN [Armatimonadota bacterium]
MSKEVAPAEMDGVETADTPTVEESQQTNSVESVRFAQLPESPVAAEQNSMDLLLDVELDLSVELGRTNIPVKDILQLGSGSIVELEKSAGDPVDIMINGKLIARGEVVVVDENFGVRITEIVSRSERLSGLG